MGKSSKKIYRIRFYRYSIILIILTTIISIIYSSYKKQLITVATQIFQSEGGIIKNFTYRKMKNGKLQFILDAPYVTIRNDVYTMQNPHVVYFSSARNYNVSAKKGIYRPNKNIDASGSVKINTSDDYHIRTERLKYNIPLKEAYAPLFVKFWGKKIRGTGSDMVMDIKNNILLVKKGVDIVITRKTDLTIKNGK